MVHYIAALFAAGCAIQELYPDWFVGIRQDGVVMGLEFDHPQGAKLVMKHLYEHGVWAIFSTLDPRVLQFKPGILLGPELVDEVLDRTEVSIGRGAAADVRLGPDGGDRRRDQRRRGRRAGGGPARSDDAPAGRVGGGGVRPVRRLRRTRSSRRRRSGAAKTPKVRRMGGAGDRHGRRRAQAAQERGLRAGSSSATATTITSTPASTPRPRSSSCRGRPAWSSR